MARGPEPACGRRTGREARPSNPSRPRAKGYGISRTVMATFWSDRARVPEAELGDDVHDEGRGDALTAPMHAQAWVERVLSALPGNYRQVLELRFLRGYSLRETAEATGNTVGAIKVMQLRALRAAARLGSP
ncbi:MAG: hypothetical protein E6J05_01085 [Chloroflexi bacterium]|nr:MAG: hypothetical protein E6J05_01085 [Chloroflexota bacterium]